MTEEHVDPIELLKDEMGNDDVPSKVNAIHRLSTVVLAISTPQVYEKVIPLLDSKLIRYIGRFDSQRRG